MREVLLERSSQAYPAIIAATFAKDSSHITTQFYLYSHSLSIIAISTSLYPVSLPSPLLCTSLYCLSFPSPLLSILGSILSLSLFLCFISVLLSGSLYFALFCLSPTSLTLCTSLCSVSIPSPSLSILGSVFVSLPSSSLAVPRSILSLSLLSHSSCSIRAHTTPLDLSACACISARVRV